MNQKVPRKQILSQRKCPNKRKRKLRVVGSRDCCYCDVIDPLLKDHKKKIVMFSLT